jgi:hypothetical protein
MLNFSQLPIDVYHVIHQYLLNYDYHEFLNTSKAVFSEVKHRTMRYHLRLSDPFDPADAGLITDAVTSKVMNKGAQIFVSFEFDCFCFHQASVVNPARLNLHIPIDIHTLKLDGCYHNDNLCFTGREGGYLHTLEIRGMYRNDDNVEYDFSSVSATFPFLHKLVVGDCRIMSVSPLLDIPYIELTDVVLPGMKTSGHLSSDFDDVNLRHTHFHYDVGYDVGSAPFISTLLPFKDVRDLFLQGDFTSSNSAPGYSLSCQFLTLTNLGVNNRFPLHLKKPKKLSFSNLDLQIFMVDNVTELEEVSLVYCSNVDLTLFRNAKKIKIEHSATAPEISNFVSFQFLSHVSLTWCYIVDVSLFSNVRSVELKDCRLLTCLEGLGKSTERRKGNRHVTVSDCSRITNFSPLNSLHSVHIHNCVGFTDGNQVKDVVNLIISGCSKIESFHMFGKVHSLRIDSCRHLATLFGLQDVPYIQIRHCENLKEIKGLKSNQYVEIQNCRLLHRKRADYKTWFSFLPHFSIT